MTFYIYDVNGYVSDYASTRGAMELDRFLEAQDNEILQFFVDEGYYPDPAELLSVLKGLTPRDETVRATLLELWKTLKCCKEIVIVTNGFVTKEVAEKEEETGAQCPIDL